jgi:hypothetical protein
MVFHLAAPYIQDQLSLRSWKPGGTLTVRVKYRGPFRLPAVRVTGVLAGPAQERSQRIAGSGRGAGGSGVSPFSKAAGRGKFWDSSKAVASSAVTLWNNMVETHSARWSQSLQTLQRVGSRILRSMSHDSMADAAGGEGSGESGGEHGCAAATPMQDAAAAAHAAVGAASFEQQQQAAAMAAAMAAAHAAAAAAVAEQPATAASLEEQEALLQRQLDQLGQLQASLSRFVTTASRREVNRACMLADLSNIAYDVRQILDGNLLEARHGLRLVACSHPDHAPAAGGEACALPGGSAEARQAAEVEALIEMSLSPQWEAWESEEAAAAASALAVRLMAGAAGTAGPAATCWDGAGCGGFGGGLQLSPRSPVVVSAMTVLEDDGAAGAACCSGAGGSGAATTAAGMLAPAGSPPAGGRRGATAAPRAMAAAGCLDAPVMPAPTAPRPAAPQQQLHAWVPSPQPECTDEAVDALEPSSPPTDASAASVPAAPAFDSDPPARAAAPMHPADWFVCDAPADAAAGAPATRFIVIQGSITMDHWRINLTFDPVPFESAATGVKVHRCAAPAGFWRAGPGFWAGFLQPFGLRLAVHARMLKPA